MQLSVNTGPERREKDRGTKHNQPGRGPCSSQYAQGQREERRIEGQAITCQVEGHAALSKTGPERREKDRGTKHNLPGRGPCSSQLAQGQREERRIEGRDITCPVEGPVALSKHRATERREKREG